MNFFRPASLLYERASSKFGLVKLRQCFTLGLACV
jgi:hypothetical protein